MFKPTKDPCGAHRETDAPSGGGKIDIFHRTGDDAAQVLTGGGAARPVNFPET